MIEILYFARVRENLGLDREQLELPRQSMKVSELIDHLSSNRDAIWGEILGQDNLLVSVNQVMVQPDHELRDLDEIAFFPPVSGG
jgi:molybdopterin synthase sulfur carrier subunit